MSADAIGTSDTLLELGAAADRLERERDELQAFCDRVTAELAVAKSERNGFAQAEAAVRLERDNARRDLEVVINAAVDATQKHRDETADAVKTLQAQVDAIANARDAFAAEACRAVEALAALLKRYDTPGACTEPTCFVCAENRAILNQARTAAAQGDAVTWLAEHDKEVARIAVLEHVGQRKPIHSWANNPQGIACEKVLSGGYTATDQNELVTCRDCLEIALGWTPPTALGASRTPVGPGDAAELAAFAFVSRDLVHRAFEEIAGASGTELSSEKRLRAAVLLKEALGL